MDQFNELDQIIRTDARALPVILLLDCSGSMSGPKINTLNSSVNAMLSSFASSSDSDVAIKTAIITFGGNDAKVLKPYGTTDEQKMVDLQADGCTPLGAALKKANEIISDKTIISSRDYRPTVILVSDGMPNDAGWERIMDDFIHTGRTSKCFRWALAVGTEAEGVVFKMLKSFVSNEEFLFKSTDAGSMKKFFQKVTVSTVARSQSATPNAPATAEEESAAATIIEIPDDYEDDFPF